MIITTCCFQDGLNHIPRFVASRAGQLAVAQLLLRLRVDVEKDRYREPNNKGQIPSQGIYP